MTRTYGGIQTHRLGFLKSIVVHDKHLDVHTAEKTKEKRIKIETQHDFNNSNILIIKKKNLNMTIIFRKISYKITKGQKRKKKEKKENNSTNCQII